MRSVRWKRECAHDCASPYAERPVKKERTVNSERAACSAPLPDLGEGEGAKRPRVRDPTRAQRVRSPRASALANLGLKDTLAA
jgi:hypothetical protein